MYGVYTYAFVDDPRIATGEVRTVAGTWATPLKNTIFQPKNNSVRMCLSTATDTGALLRKQ